MTEKIVNSQYGTVSCKQQFWSSVVFQPGLVDIQWFRKSESHVDGPWHRAIGVSSDLVLGRKRDALPSEEVTLISTQATGMCVF
jgi:hypothetical protein